jgi:hypothetical protein
MRSGVLLPRAIFALPRVIFTQRSLQSLSGQVVSDPKQPQHARCSLLLAQLQAVLDQLELLPKR